MTSQEFPKERISQDCTSKTPRDITWLPRQLHDAVARLLNAHRYAQDVGDDYWNFAVRVNSLELTSADIRWLLKSGFVRCALEVTLPGEMERAFHHAQNSPVSDVACFVLTPAGVEFAKQLERLREATESVATPADCAGLGRLGIGFRSEVRVQASRHGTSRNGADGNGASRQAGTGSGTTDNGEHAHRSMHSAPLQKLQRPHWDRDRQELRVGSVVVKRFKAPAPNQEMILAAFEEENWPPRIDDPLTPVPDLEPKRRLHDTINSLNRNQKDEVLRFVGDGTGQGVLWEFSDGTTLPRKSDVSEL